MKPEREARIYRILANDETTPVVHRSVKKAVGSA